MPELLRWLNGWVYEHFGAEALLAFDAHPFLYLFTALGVAVVVLAALLWWLRRRVRRMRRSLGVAAGLALSRPGRRCLRQARQIRRGGARLRVAIRCEVPDRVERRALLRLLERFTHSELLEVLEHALRLLRRPEPRTLPTLQAELQRQQAAWSAAGDDAQREGLQQAIAATRQRLAAAQAIATTRQAHLQGLQEAAQAVLLLEHELGELRLARAGALPEFRDRLQDAALQLGHLKSAYQELNAPAGTLRD